MAQSFEQNPDAGNWIILINGIRVYPNGTDKRCWSTKGGARYALNNHLMYNGFISDMIRNHRNIGERDVNNAYVYFSAGRLGEYQGTIYESGAQMKDVITALIKEKRIEIIQIQ